jgi:CxxC motif-containing protein (DUF1111 family)
MTMFSRHARLRSHARVLLPAVVGAAAVCGLWPYASTQRVEAADPPRGAARVAAKRPAGPLTAEERAKRKADVEAAKRLAYGKQLFNHEWQPRIPGNGFGDGLGPLFNERSCAACHRLGGLGGAGPWANNVQLIVAQRLPAGDKWETTHDAQREYVLPTATADTFLLHRHGTSPGYDVWRRQRLSLVEGAQVDPVLSPEMRILHLQKVGLELTAVNVPVANGLINGTQQVVVPPTLVSFVKEERNTTALFGAGLIDKVQEKTLTEIAESQKKEIRGRVPRTGARRLGRFGWKGQNETLLEFNEGACAAELGLETGKMRQVKAPQPTYDLASKANTFNISRGIDITPQDIAAMSDYVASLPAPIRVEPHDKSSNVLFGERKFFEIGCADCHRQDVGEIKGLYSDLLLHRIGLTGYGATYYGNFVEPPLELVEAADPKRTADPDEFRTPPLWGVADSAPYLHDGRAATLHEAISLHGGQARESSFAYAKLHEWEQKQIVAFLKLLKAPPPVR